MPSSLAVQLTQGTSLNSSLLVDRSRRKPTESYLFTGREADRHDLESVHALATNSFAQLRQWNPTLKSYESALFSDAVKGIDRTLLPREAIEELDSVLKAFIPLLGKDLMEVQTGRVLEWLVRRFRINEFNVEDILTLFLPYHDSPHFTKMATILHIKPNTPWVFLNAYKSAAQPLPRSALVTEMLRTPEIARFVTSLHPRALRGSFAHRASIAFHTGVTMEFLARGKALDDGTVAFMLPAMLDPLRGPEAEKDVVLCSYILLSALSQKCTFDPKALKTILSVMALHPRRVSKMQLLNALVSVVSPQDVLQSLPAALTETLMAIHETDKDALPSLSWSGSEKLLIPFTSDLIDRLEEDTPTSVFDSLIAHPDTTRRVIHHIASLALSNAVAASSTPLYLRRLLSNIQQRHPDVLQAASQATTEGDADMHEAVEQLVMSLSVKYVAPQQGETKSEVDMVVASLNADANVRLRAVQKLMSLLPQSPGSKSRLDPAEQASIHSALLARIRDNSAAVVKALYSQPATLLPVALADPSAYLSTVAETVARHGPGASRALLRLHLSFLAEQFTPAARPEFADKVLVDVFFPLLLFTKPRSKTALTVWGVIEAAEKTNADAGLARCELIRGCTEVWRWEEAEVRKKKDKPATSHIESPYVMGKVNIAIASRMAENILISNNYAAHLAFLISTLSHPEPHTRNLAYLVCRSLLGHMSGEHQLDAAQQILNGMNVTTLEGMEGFMKGADSLQEFLGDDSLGVNLVLKPRSRDTLHWLQTSVLAIMPILVRPSGVSLNLLDDGPSGDADTRNARYVGLMRSIYKLANSSTSLPILSGALLRAQFINLADDTLAFLSGIWVSDSESLRRIALSHAVAFLAAHENADSTVDFQTVLPAVMVALTDADVAVRGLAIECIDWLARLCKAERASGVYAFDTIYGKHSVQLQYLDWGDYGKYVESLVEQREHFRSDPGYIRVFHQEYLARAASDSKKIQHYKKRVLCYILSHANACTVASVKLILLHMVEDVSDRVKAPAMASTIQMLIDDTQSQELRNVFGPRFDEYASLAVSSFDVFSAQDLNDKSSNLWSTYADAARRYLSPGSSVWPRDSLVHNLKRGLFTHLIPNRQFQLIQLIVSVGAEATEARAQCLSVLADILAGVPLLTRLLTVFSPVTKEDAQRAPKRAKVDSAKPSENNIIAHLTFFAESLSGISVPGSIELISSLLDVLNKVAQSDSTSSADTVYIEQLLMSAIDSAAANVPLDTLGATSAPIRLDILVDIIRVSENPQIFHQALLLMANLARLTPESVLHNIMPVFTFMGSNVFHRDDTYSFRVIQKTIDNIVPVMVSSLRTKHSTHLDLLVASRDFLRIFTDAANHVPRHRRTHFFIHLIDVLDPREFLALVSMLILGKSDRRITRQKGDDLRATLALPLSLVHHYPASVHVPVLVQHLREAQRLLSYAVDPSNSEPILLDSSQDEDWTPQSLRRRAQSLLIFVGHALGSSSLALADPAIPEGSVNDLVSILLEITSVRDGDEENNFVMRSARIAIAQCLRVIPAINFVESVARMLGGSEVAVQAEALSLLADRLPTVADSVRREATPTVIKILDNIKDLLSSGKSELIAPAFLALKAISVTLNAGEETALVSCVPLLITALRDGTHQGDAIAVLPSLSAKLGPRIIPFFRDIIQESVRILSEAINHSGAGITASSDDSLDVLRELFKAIPAFWGSSELANVFRLYLDYQASPSGGDRLSALAKSLASKASTKVVLSTLFDIWSSMAEEESPARLEGFFGLVKRALHAAPRASTLEFLRPTFKLVLEGLDLRKKVSHLDISKVEATTIATFLELVTKLNETAFRPLFRKLFDWAFTDATVDRKISFCHTYMVLLGYFKALMTPYLSLLLQPFMDILQASPSASNGDEELWLAVLETLTKGFSVDEGAFWREDKLQRIIPSLVAQVSTNVDLDAKERGKQQVLEVLSALCDVVNDDALLKKINLDVLMHTRSEDSRVRLFALQSSKELWSTHGDKLIGYVSETITFMAECAEDEHDSVVKATHDLKKAVESATGESIDSL